MNLNRLTRLITPIVVGISLLLAVARPVLAQGQVIETGAPVCSIIYYPGATPSSLGSEWLLLDGSSVSKLTYPQLFDCFGYAYGGSGNNFNLPNYTGRFILSATNIGGGYPVGNAGGEISHTLSINEIPSHRHPIYTRDGYSGAASYPVGRAGYNTSNDTTYTGFTGGGQPHNNMPPYGAAWAMIKAKPTLITITVSLTQVITSTQNITLTQVISMNGQIPYSVYTTTLSSGDVFTVERRETYGDKVVGGLIFFNTLVLVLAVIIIFWIHRKKQ